MKGVVVVVSVFAMTFFFAGFAEAVDNSGHFAAGFQSSWPVYGISGKYWKSPQLGFQATLAMSGRWSGIGGRLLYKFKGEENYDLFGGGEVGYWTWLSSGGYSSVSSIGFGAFAGVEYFPIETLKQLGFSLELGMRLVKFSESYVGTLGSFGFGGGVHWYF